MSALLGIDSCTDAVGAADDSGPMRGVMRTLQVLRALNVRNGAGVSQLARDTKMSRAALYRVLETLRGAGYVSVDLSQRHYCLTFRIKELAEGFNDEDWIAQVARPEIRALQRILRWPIDLATFMDGAMWIRESTRPVSPLTIDRGCIGASVPILLSASGRAYLAHCESSDREIIIRHIIESETPGCEMASNRALLDAMLTKTRSNGFGIRDGGFAPESGAIAVPILLRDRVLGCVTLTFSKRLSSLREIVAWALPAMRMTAHQIATGRAHPTNPVIVPRPSDAYW
jgi:IclR family transcriptional regulator, mhp operon transcriptional activator